MYGVFIGGVCALVVGMVVLLGPVLSMSLVAAGAALVTFILRPAWTAWAAMFLGLTAFPAFIPYSIQLGSTTLFLFEPFLFLAGVWAVRTHPSVASAKLRATLLAVLIGLAALMGVALEHPAVEVVSDGRGLLTVLLSLVVASRLFAAPQAGTALRILRYSLWTSLIVIALSIVFKFKLAGRTEAASLFLNSSGAGTSESTRFLTAATVISVVVLCATLALVLTDRATLRGVSIYLLPALLITFLGFSRNNFLAVGMAIIFALILARTMKPLAVAAKISLLVGVPVFILGLAHAAVGLPGGDFVMAQVDTFMSRVVGGLDSSTLTDDTSVIARVNEDAYFIKAIAESPVVGHGFGYAYRPPAGPPGSFSATKGQYYGHNFYLWITVKAGLLGLVAFAVVAIAPVLSCLRHRTTETVALGAAGAGLLLSIAFAPFPNDIGNGGSLAVGLLLGSLIAAVHTARSTGQGLLGGRPATEPVMAGTSVASGDSPTEGRLLCTRAIRASCSAES